MTPLRKKSIGECFYYHIWKTLSVGTKVRITKDDVNYTCEIIERTGTERYKLKILSKENVQKVEILEQEDCVIHKNKDVKIINVKVIHKGKGISRYNFEETEE